MKVTYVLEVDVVDNHEHSLARIGSDILNFLGMNEDKILDVWSYDEIKIGNVQVCGE